MKKLRLRYNHLVGQWLLLKGTRFYNVRYFTLTELTEIYNK